MTELNLALGDYTHPGHVTMKNNKRAYFGDAKNSALFTDGSNTYLDLLGEQKLHVRQNTDTKFTIDPVTGDFTLVGDMHGLSDRHAKRDVTPLSDALEKVLQIGGYDFRYKDSDKWHTGVIAQEVLKVLPNVVSLGSDGKYTVAYANMVGLLIEAIKELNAKIEMMANSEQTISRQ